MHFVCIWLEIRCIMMAKNIQFLPQKTLCVQNMMFNI